MSANTLLDLPEELLSNILSPLHPRDILRFGSVNLRAQHFTSPSNQILWHFAFLQVFDEPENAWSMLPASYAAPKDEWDWYGELRRRMLALRAISKGWATNGAPEDAESHLNALLSMIDTAKFCPTKNELDGGKIPQFDDRSSMNLQMLGHIPDCHIGLDKLIHDTRLRKSNSANDSLQSPGRRVTRTATLSAEETDRPESACRLHVLHGITVRERRDRRSRGVARRKVYNWSLTSRETDYGPFLLDGSGRTNWNLLAGICSVICRNFELCVDGHIALPQGVCYAIPHRTLADPTIPEDWARITGLWLGTYAFLDYADLFNFNTGTHHSHRSMLEDEREACGDLMKLELKLDFSVKDDPRLQTAVPYCTDLPPLFFVGRSRGQDFHQRPTVEVKGLVVLMPGAREVRWKFIIAYNGADQWQLEGIQPGGIRSGGVYGLWSQVDHEENAPIGPFCYFPAELCKPTSVVLVD